MPENKLKLKWTNNSIYNSIKTVEYLELLWTSYVLDFHAANLKTL